MNILITDKSLELRNKSKSNIDKIFIGSRIYETDSNIKRVSILFKVKPNLIITDLDLIEDSRLGLLSFIKSLCPVALVIVFTNQILNDIKLFYRKMGFSNLSLKYDELIQLQEFLKLQKEQ